MPNLSQWAIWSVLLWSTLTHASLPTFEWQDPDTDEELLCHKCPPGTSMAKPCTWDTLTECKPCGDKKYTEDWNNLDRCLYCSFPCDDNAVEVAPCTTRHDRVCECKPGYHNELDLCIKHLPCPPGAGVVKPGTTTKDTECRVCPKGTFSRNFSTEESCQTHQNCASRGLGINVPGTIFHDTYCTACRPDKGSGKGDCYEAALDFVAFQLTSSERLQRLYRMLTQTPPGTEKKQPIIGLQLDLHSYLLQLKNLIGKKRAWDTVQVALKKMKLEQILQNVQRLFSVG